MKNFLFRPVFLLFLPIAFTFTACPVLPAAGAGMVTQVVRIIGKQAARWAVAEAIEYGMDVGFSWIFSSAANKSSNAYNDNVIPIPGRPGFGHLSHEARFDVKSKNRQKDFGVNHIKIPGVMVEFARTEFGTWELTAQARAMIKERIEVATAQQVLKGYGYNPRGIDGVYGNRSKAAVLKMKQDFPGVFGARPDDKLDYQARQFLLTY